MTILTGLKCGAREKKIRISKYEFQKILEEYKRF